MGSSWQEQRWSTGQADGREEKGRRRETWRLAIWGIEGRRESVGRDSLNGMYGPVEARRKKGHVVNSMALGNGDGMGRTQEMAVISFSSPARLMPTRFSRQIVHSGRDAMMSERERRAETMSV
jgi:hypothetical protein